MSIVCMKKLIKKVLISCAFVICFLWIFVDASWVSEACITDARCDDLLDKPYCVSDDVDNTGCIWWWLANNLNTEPVYNVKDIIEQYCRTFLWSDKRSWRIYYAKPSVYEDYEWWDWQQTFDSNQSLFVYALCSSFKNETNSPFLSGTSIDLSEVFQSNDIAGLLKLQQISNDDENYCDFNDKYSMNRCDMSLYATEIFSSIMSEIFKIWYAQIFHLNTVQDYDNKEAERVVNFFSGYYSIVEDVKTYDKLKSRFPQTIEIINSDHLFYKQVLDKLKLIDNSKLVEIMTENECSETWDIKWLQYIACALHGSEWNGVALNKAFLTLCYNEILNYKVFVSYYTQMLTKLAQRSNDTQKMIFNAQELDLKNYSDMQVDAVYQTLSDMEDMSMTYPLHIGLLLYQERIKKFRNQYLSPIVTLFYSLSEKLQNVQIQE